MSINYTPITDFLVKDTLPKEDPDKVILGADFDGEFEAISTAFLGAASVLDPTFSGTVTFDVGVGNSLTVDTLTAKDITVTGVLSLPGGDVATEDYVDDRINEAVLAPITDLGDLADVNVAGVADGETIIWDDTNSEWIPLTGNLFLNVDANSVKSDSFVETHSVTTGVLDCSVSNIFSAVLTGPLVLSFTNVPAVDGAYACTLELEAAGNAVTWPTGIVWPEATPPTLSAGRDIIVFFTRDAGTTWNGFVAGQEMG
jgi:hypothetical protein